MGDFEEKLSAILGDQQAMGQIMALAQSLSGGGEGQSPPSVQSQLPEEVASLSPLDQLDPDLLRIGGKLLEEYRRGDDRNAALLLALKPFLRRERYARLDRAVQLARMARVIRVGLGSLGLGREGDHV